ncbi:Acyl carrier protein [Saccharicrinis carchari]|uniref:Acyl carrier protein n=1 Tax=Saccharicrinis carchari TaxID=1168039 RepID=A0A521BTR6_SACCC|nr:acyl carrier protein [Saccharicrinis carchari]SMO50548.1 Acyl carrier protein [Saccharicrinis carchari]
MKDKFITALAEALEMDESDVKMADKFRDYESYDSLAELSVLAMLDSDFEVEIEMDEYNKYQTVEELYKRISTK